MLRERALLWAYVSLTSFFIVGVSFTGASEPRSNKEDTQFNHTGWQTSPLSFSMGFDASPRDNHNTTNTSADHGEGNHSGIHIVTFRWSEVGIYFTVTAFIVIAGFTKLVFHHLHFLSRAIPESCVLVVLGVALGLIVFFNKSDPAVESEFNIPLPHFTSDLFFFVLLPPIVLESAYSLHDRAFFDNLGTVLVYAVVGTMFNIFAIGPTLYGVASIGAMGDITLSMRECLVFSSLISAVDPVAVLAIFQELGVNKDLYFLVFGESLLNDGVTVVVYNTMNTFLTMESLPAAQYVLAVVSFFVVIFMGLFIGMIYGFITAAITKVASDVRVMEPLALLGLGYLCYLTAELFHFSGIISLIMCGLVQAQYAFPNISQKSYTCVKYFTKMASATSDTIIFMFLGMVLVSDHHVWHTGFVLWTILLCFVFRFISVFILTGLMNHYRIRKIGLEEQFIAAYGGLRGAVAFSLVIMLDESLEPRAIFVTTTLIVILFTMFIQGATIKPLVGFLQIQRKRTDRKTLNEEINDTLMDHIMAGTEEILGQHGDFYLRALLIHYNDRFLKKWFVKPSCEAKLTRLFEKIAISEHYAHLYGPVAMIEDNVKPLCMPDTTKGKLVRANSVSPCYNDEVLLEPGILVDDDDDAELVHDGVQLRKKKKRKSALPLFPSRQSTRRVGASERNIDSAYPSHPNLIENEDVRDPELANAEDGSQKEASHAAQALRKAFKDNPYNKLHYKHNINLVGEEYQELSEHLQRRHFNARRMSSLASNSISFMATPDASRRKTDGTATNEGGVRGRSGLYEGAEELRDRHQRRRHTMAVRRRNQRPVLQTCLSSPESSGSLSSLVPLPPPVTLKTLPEVSPQESSEASLPESPKETRKPGIRPELGRSYSLDVANETEEEMSLMQKLNEDLDYPPLKKEDVV